MTRRLALALPALALALTACAPAAETGTATGTAPSVVLDDLRTAVEDALAPTAATAAPTAAVPTGRLPAFRTAPYTSSDQVDTTTAKARLAALPVKGRAPKTGYKGNRVALFGQAWKDMDKNGCDTRSDVMSRDLTSIAYKPGTRNCVVVSGVLYDPYSGKTIQYDKKARPNAVQGEHVVALSDAWQKGAQQWKQPEREAFANDPLNVMMIDGPTNGSKSDGDAATWLPPNKAYGCAYSSNQVEVKSAYGLWVTKAEKAALASLLDTCPKR